MKQVCVCVFYMCNCRSEDVVQLFDFKKNTGPCCFNCVVVIFADKNCAAASGAPAGW